MAKKKPTTRKKKPLTREQDPKKWSRTKLINDKVLQEMLVEMIVGCTKGYRLRQEVKQYAADKYPEDDRLPDQWDCNAVIKPARGIVAHLLQYGIAPQSPNAKDPVDVKPIGDFIQENIGVLHGIVNDEYADPKDRVAAFKAGADVSPTHPKYKSKGEADQVFTPEDYAQAMGNVDAAMENLIVDEEHE